MTERLDKLISDSGLYSRSEARTLVRAGRVSVDGETVTAPERKFPREAAVRVDGAAVNCSRYRYFMLDKPAGYVCATEDRSLPTVLELLPAEYRGLGLFPVGRLDRDTTGCCSHERRRLRPPRHLAEVEGGKVLPRLDRGAGDGGGRLCLRRGPHARGWNTMPAREARAAGGRALPRARHGGQVPPGKAHARLARKARHSAAQTVHRRALSAGGLGDRRAS
ncbi:MAG: S4 domain-containing protein [Oscillospiraceae bacterium]